MANGLFVMRDEETNSLWDHITGECFEGPLAGEQLPFWPIEMATVESALHTHPDLVLLKSDSMLLMRMVMSLGTAITMGRNFINGRPKKIFRPFRATMSAEPDVRLPERTQGLGVMDEEHHGKFYPMMALPQDGQIEDLWQGRRVIISQSQIDGFPKARWADGEGSPMQMLTRWYGFAFTYPDCEIYSPLGE